MAPSKDTSLDFMTRLSSHVFYHDPKTTHLPNHPSLILFAGWMGARNAHLAKYTAQYQLLFPTSRILLITYSVNDFISYPADKIQPAVDILRAEVKAAKEEGKGDEVRVLWHLFSNGGAGTTRHLFETIDKLDGKDAKVKGELALPRHVFIADSAPGDFHWMDSYSAMAASLPRWIHPLLHVWIIVGIAYYAILRRPTWFHANVLGLRETSVLAAQNVRLYFYGTKDIMVRPSDIENDAAAVKELVQGGEVKDGPVVRMERFEGSKHVSHARTDFERYWKAVEDAWAARNGS
jgi:hypothetical protein